MFEKWFAKQAPEQVKINELQETLDSWRAKKRTLEGNVSEMTGVGKDYNLGIDHSVIRNQAETIAKLKQEIRN